MFGGKCSLRYVSGDIEYENLKYTPLFKTYLIRKVGDFDDYIEKLEKICSVIFVFSFLLLFMFISLTAFIIFIGLLSSILRGISSPHWLRLMIGFSIVFFSIIYFLDFITLGWFKKWKWWAKLYYPFYRLLSFITFSNYYRPLYYNLISNKYGRRVGYAILPYLLILFGIAGLIDVDGHRYFAEEISPYQARGHYYGDEFDENILKKGNYLMDHAFIASKVINEDYLEVFLNNQPATDNDAIAQLYPELPELSDGGFFHEIRRASDETKRIYEGIKLNENSEDYLNALGSLYELSIDDSLYSTPEYVFYQHPITKQKGLFTVLNIEDFDKGRHTLFVRKKQFIHGSNTLSQELNAVIPFFRQ